MTAPSGNGGNGGNGASVQGPGFAGTLRGPLAIVAACFCLFLAVGSWVALRIIEGSTNNTSRLEAAITEWNRSSVLELRALRDQISDVRATRVQAGQAGMTIPLICTPAPHLTVTDGGKISR